MVEWIPMINHGNVPGAFVEVLYWMFLECGVIFEFGIMLPILFASAHWVESIRISTTIDCPKSPKLWEYLYLLSFLAL